MAAAPAGRACPTSTDDDVVGSAYCIRDYTVDDAPRRRRRRWPRPARRWRTAASALMLDFVPNHVAPDHRWAVDAPRVLRARDGRRPGRRPRQLPRRRRRRHRPRPRPVLPGVARGRSSSTPRARRCGRRRPSRRRLDRRPLRRRALRHGDADARRRLRAHVGRRATGGAVTGRRPGLLADRDGRRAGDATRTSCSGPRPTGTSNRSCVEQGFDACYDKRLYDRLVDGEPASAVRAHLGADPAYQAAHRAVRREPRRAPRWPPTLPTRAGPGRGGGRADAARRGAAARGSGRRAPGAGAGDAGPSARRAARRRAAGVVRPVARAPSATGCGAASGRSLDGRGVARQPVVRAPGGVDVDGPTTHRHLVVVNLSDERADGMVQWPDVPARPADGRRTCSTARRSSATAPPSPPTACTSPSTAGPPRSCAPDNRAGPPRTRSARCGWDATTRTRSALCGRAPRELHAGQHGAGVVRQLAPDPHGAAGVRQLAPDPHCAAGRRGNCTLVGTVRAWCDNSHQIRTVRRGGGSGRRVRWVRRSAFAGSASAGARHALDRAGVGHGDVGRAATVDRRARVAPGRRPVRGDRVPGVGRDAVRAVLRRLLPAAGEQRRRGRPTASISTCRGRSSSRSSWSPRRSRWCASDRAGERPGGQRAMRRWLLATIALGAAFLAQPARSSTARSTSAPTTDPYGSIYWVAHRSPRRPRHGRVGGDGPAVRPRRAQPHAGRRRLVGGRRLAVLAPRRRRLAVRVHDDLDPAVNLAAAACPRRRRGQSPAIVVAHGAGAERRRRSAGPERRRPRRRALRRPVRQLPRRSTARASRIAARRCYGEGGRRSTSCCAPAGCRWPHPDMEAQRGPVRYSEAEIRALVAYAGRVRRRTGDPRRRHRPRRPRRRRRPLPPQLRGLPRRLRLGRGDRRRPRGADLMDATPTEIGRGDPRRPRRDAGVRLAQRRRTSTTSPATSTTSSDGRRPASTTSVAPDRSPKGWPPGCSPCCRSSP